MKLKPFLISICVTSTILVLLYFWTQHFRLGLVRYFDADEFMYPHWAHNVYKGQIPYKDFFIITTPLYLYAIKPIFWFFADARIFVFDRIGAFFIAASIGTTLGLLFYQNKRSWVAITVPLLFALLPMPQDKYMEIRPDNLALLFFLIGLLFFQKKPFVSGIVLGLSLLTLQKMLPFVGILMLFVFFHKKNIPYFIAGLAFILLPFTIWAIRTPNAFYWIIKAPVEHAIAMQKINGVPFDFYFHPNNTYYGVWGFSAGYITNMLMWAIATIFAIIRVRREPLMSVLFLTSVFLYIFFHPLKFPQYLIPSGAFVAYFCADILDFLRKKIHILVFSACVIVLLLVAWHVFDSVTLPKFAWTNTEDLQKIDTLVSTIPAGSYVLDLEGRSTFFNDPYVICCLPFGQFSPALSRPLPSLIEALKATKTTYIHQGAAPRVTFQQPQDQEFIRTHYKPTLDGSLWVLTAL